MHVQRSESSNAVAVILLCTNSEKRQQTKYLLKQNQTLSNLKKLKMKAEKWPTTLKMSLGKYFILEKTQFIYKNYHQLTKYGQFEGLIGLSGLQSLFRWQVMQGKQICFRCRILTSSSLTKIYPFIFSISIIYQNLSRLQACLMASFLIFARVLSFFKISAIKSSFSAFLSSCSSSSFSWKSIQTFKFFFSLLFTDLIKLKLARALSSSSTCLAGIDVRLRMSAFVRWFSFKRLQILLATPDTYQRLRAIFQLSASFINYIKEWSYQIQNHDSKLFVLQKGVRRQQGRAHWLRQFRSSQYCLKQVYRVFDSETQNYLAIRRVDRDLGQSEDIQKQKTINEELRRVENEHILKIFDIIESVTCIWYITEYCEGGSLWDALNNCTDNKMNERDALEVIYQVSKGVKELHNHRITHRDLKPENILLKTKYIAGKPIPKIKIADFGLSTKKIIMETIAGTKEYIAPEQARFHNYTNAVDVWSLGIIFDQILHGSPFYVGEHNKEVFQKILKNPYKVRDETIRPSIQEFLISVLKKKAYQRPIIAVICQNIQKIIQEIKKQRKEPQEIHEKSLNFEKKNMKSLPFLQQEPKSPLLSVPQPQTTRQPVNASLKDVVQTESRIIPKFEDKSQSKVEERKAKTPFKRQNGRPELFKSNEELQMIEPSSALSSIHRNPRAVLTHKKEGQNKSTNRDKSKENPSHTEPNEKNQSIEIDKINVYRVDKKKIQTLPSKNIEINPVITDVKDYMESVIKMKNDLLQSSIAIGKDREFIPNAQLTINDFPEKFDGEGILQKLKKNYDYLNYVNYKQDYEIKLYIGKNTLNQQKIKAEKQMLDHKQKIKKCFLGQIDKFVDYYIQKTLK